MGTRNTIDCKDTSKNTVISDGVIGRGGMLRTLDIQVHPFDSGYKFRPAVIS
jgi:hypothetical protein